MLVSPKAVFQVPIWKHGLLLGNTHTHNNGFQRKNETTTTRNERGRRWQPYVDKKRLGGYHPRCSSMEGQKDETTGRLWTLLLLLMLLLPMGTGPRWGHGRVREHKHTCPRGWASPKINIIPSPSFRRRSCAGGRWACASLTGGGRDAVGHRCAWAAMRRHARCVMSDVTASGGPVVPLENKP